MLDKSFDKFKKNILFRTLFTVVLILAVLASLFLLSSCTGLPVTPFETEAPLNEEPDARITAYSIAEAKGGIIINLKCDIDKELEGCELLIRLFGDNSKELNSITIDPPLEPTDVFIECEPEKVLGEICAELLLYKDARHSYGGITLKIAYGLPQLTPYGVKCVLNVMTDEEKAELVTGHSPKKQGASGATLGLWKYGIPSVTVNDGPAGIRYAYGIWYPSVMNISSSWDRELVETVGRAIGEDTLAQGIDVILAPGMDMQKYVLGGRNFEYCSEDPLLTGLTAAAYVNGVQSSCAGACLKHFAANDQETYRGSVSVVMTERALREIYLRPFRIAVEKSSPLTVMSSYNSLNGTHTSVNRELLTGILRDEFGFRGAVMSDWGAAGSVVDKVKAQNDLNMPGNAGDKDAILSALEKGELSREELDRCCENILNVVADSASFNEYPMNTGIDYDGHSALAADVAADTFVLLQNENDALPLKKGTSVVLFGNGADKTVLGGSGSGSVIPQKTVNIFDGIENSKKLVCYDYYNDPFRWCDPHDPEKPNADVRLTEEYAELSAKEADCAVIVISRSSTEGADNKAIKGDYYLSDNEAEMIDRASEAFHREGKRVIVLLNVGNPIEVVSWREKVDAIMMIGYPGEGAGTAVAKVLSGDVNPSGKLSMTWPKDYSDTPAKDYFPGNQSQTIYYDDIYVGYRYYSTFGVDVAYPFGYGLSYTEFKYSNFKVTATAQGNYYAEVVVRNTGKRKGREVVEFYVSKPGTTLEQPSYELCGFVKTSAMKAGQYQKAKVLIKASDIASYDTENSRYIVESGDFVFRVGSSAGTFYGEQTVNRPDVTVVAEAENRCAPAKKFDVLKKSES